MSSYHTEQKKILIEFMTENRERELTVDEITAGLEKCAVSSSKIPGRSTVYRLINRLVEEGKIRRFVKADSRKATYQLVACEHCDLHLHLKCTDCGKLFHMDESISDELIKRISACSNFSVSEEESVLYGVCASCNRK